MKHSHNKHFRSFNLCIFSTFLYAMLSGTILVLMMFCQGLSHAYQRSHLSNWLLLPGCFVLVCGLLFLFSYMSGKLTTRLVLLLTPAFLGFQLLLIRSYFFHTGWDVDLVLCCAADVASDAPVDGYKAYFSSFPNNLVLVWLLSRIFRLAFHLHLSPERAYLMILGCICVGYSVASLLCYDAGRRITGSHSAAFLAYFLCFLLIGLSPWLSIPYSDSFGLVFPIACVWLWLLQPEKKFFKVLQWFSIGFLSVIGYQLKPQIAIVLIAIMVFFPRRMSLKHSRGWLLRLSALLTGTLLALMVGRAAIESLGIPLDRNKQIGPAHFLMMGLNTEYDGGFYLPDSAYSASFNTSFERTAADLKEAGARVKKMGVSGMLVHLVKKTLTNFDDGSFAWGFEGLYEGEFIRELRDADGEHLATVSRKIYYPNGKLFSCWVNVVQALWLTVLVFGFISCFFHANFNKSLLTLSLTGVVLFAMLFEARARYLFVSVPLFVLLAANGVFELLIFTSGKSKHRD